MPGLWRDVLPILGCSTGGLLLGVPFAQPGWGVALGLLVCLSWHLMQNRILWGKLALPEKRYPALLGIWRQIYGKVESSHAKYRRRNRVLIDGLGRFRSSLANLPDAAIILKRNGNVQWFNRSARDLLQLRKRHLGNRITSELYGTEVQCFMDSKEASGSIVFTASNGQSLHLEMHRIEFGAEQLLLLVRDTTRAHHLETMRQDFIANVSHELRTPLTVILGFLEEGCKDSEPTLSIKEFRSLLKNIKKPAKRMSNLVEDLLWLSKLDSSQSPLREQLESVRVDALIRAIVDDAQQSSKGKHRFQLETDPHVGLRGVYEEMHSVFSNLVMNAVIYSPKGGEIHIQWQPREGGGARFSVRDQGIGIESEHLPRLTERFYRVDVTRSRAGGGTGLGLAIVKHALRRHESELEVQSEPGAGSTFSCEFGAQYVCLMDDLV